LHLNSHNSPLGSVNGSDSWQVGRGDKCVLMATAPAAAVTGLRGQLTMSEREREREK